MTPRFSPGIKLLSVLLVLVTTGCSHGKPVTRAVSHEQIQSTQRVTGLRFPESAYFFDF